jgi:putative redox protein
MIQPHQRETEMGVDIDIVYEGDLHCVSTHGPSRQTLTTDAPLDNGGRGSAFSPTDLVATGLGTCIVTIMGLAAKKSGLDIEGARVHVTKEMTTSGLRRIAALQVRVAVPGGHKLSLSDRALLERAAQSCPVKQTLHPDVHVSIAFSYE